MTSTDLMTYRSHKARLLTQNHRTASQNHLLQSIRGSRKAPDANMVALEKEVAPQKLFLVVRRKPLSDVPWFYRWLARWVYLKIGWASDYSVEYQGIYTDESEARWAASAPGMSYSPVPLNTSLPFETCQYGTHDFPHSDASHKYRKRELPFVAVPKAHLAQLASKLDEMDRSIDRSSEVERH